MKRLYSTILSCRKLSLLIPAVVTTVVMTALILVTSNDAKGSEPMSLLQNKPLYSVKVDAVGAKYTIRVNGISILREINPRGQIATILPVNHWMRSGENSIEILAFPDDKNEPFRRDFHLNIALLVRDYSDPDNEYTVATLVFDGKKDEDGSHTAQSSPSGIYASDKGFEAHPSGDVEVFDVTTTPRDGYDGALDVERIINIPSSLPLWAFFNSDEIPDYNAIEDDDEYEKAFESLYNEYKKIQDAIANKAIESILPMFDERNRETDLAFYREPGTTAAGIREDLLEAAHRADLELVELDIGSVGPLVEGDSRIVSLRRNIFNPTIVLNFTEGIGSRRFPIYFRIQDGQWILTR